MYLRILKKDLRRKKTMNAILLVFILLAALFVSSSMNNILAISNGVDDFFRAANMPELLVLTIDSTGGDIEKTLDEIDGIERYEITPVIYVNSENLYINGKEVEAMTSSGYYHPLGQTELKFFDQDDRVVDSVEPGTIWVAAGSMSSLGIRVGDELEVRYGDVSRTLTVAGGIKDATSIGARFIVNESDFEPFADAPGVFPGSMCYITTEDTAAVTDALNQAGTNTVFIGDWDRIRTAYVMDMVIAGILLVVSVCLILIAFVVLRFTISFTLTEEYREIGVMKAIGIPNFRIRLLYMAKYALIALIGAGIGFFGSVPFGAMMLESVSAKMVLGGNGSIAINALCSAAVVAVTLGFCYGCTGKVKKFTPVDAIRSGTTGERFKKKGILRLSKAPMKPSAFLAANDVLSNPRRFGTIVLTFALSLSLVLVLVTSVNTLKSDSLITAFGMTESDLFFNSEVLPERKAELSNYFSDDGKEKIRADIAWIEDLLTENGMEAKCVTEVGASLSLVHGENSHKCYVYQGVGSTADQYDYFEGTPPRNANEIAITRFTAEKLGAAIGDTITIRQLEGDREYIITGYFQSMMGMGDGVRLHEDAEMSYRQLTGVFSYQIDFTDEPDAAELRERSDRIKALFGTDEVWTAGEYVEKFVGIADTLDGVRAMVLAVVLIIIALVTVLMEQSFITKERGEIAILKAMGFSNAAIVQWHTLRFGIVAVIAAVISLATLIPVTEFSVGPIFSYMGADFGIEYAIKPVEVYIIYPAIVLTVTMVSAVLTAQRVRAIRSSECSNID